jgi:hypothetical protein
LATDEECVSGHVERVDVGAGVGAGRGAGDLRVDQVPAVVVVPDLDNPVVVEEVVGEVAGEAGPGSGRGAGLAQHRAEQNRAVPVNEHTADDLRQCGGARWQTAEQVSLDPRIGDSAGQRRRLPFNRMGEGETTGPTWSI